MIKTQICKVNLWCLENEAVFHSPIFDMRNDCGLQLDIALFKSIFFSTRQILLYKAQKPFVLIENAFH